MSAIPSLVLAAPPTLKSMFSQAVPLTVQQRKEKEADG